VTEIDLWEKEAEQGLVGPRGKWEKTFGIRSSKQIWSAQKLLRTMRDH
jgi:hypothetical protein